MTQGSVSPASSVPSCTHEYMPHSPGLRLPTFNPRARESEAGGEFKTSLVYRICPGPARVHETPSIDRQTDRLTVFLQFGVWLHMCPCATHVGAGGGQKSCRIPWNRSYRLLKLICQCWELIQFPLEEQPVFSHGGLLQPPNTLPALPPTSAQSHLCWD